LYAVNIWVRCCCQLQPAGNVAQGDATAALAAIASRNRSHLPDAPLADGYAVVAARRGLADIAANGRLRRRAALLLLAWLSASLVGTRALRQRGPQCGLVMTARESDELTARSICKRGR
jgi:hypothetical protein